MTTTQIILEVIDAITSGIITIIVIAALLDSRIISKNQQQVNFVRNGLIKSSSLLKAFAITFIVHAAIILILLISTGCAPAQAIKPYHPQQAQQQPAKADKTFMQTFIQFFEHRD